MKGKRSLSHIDEIVDTYKHLLGEGCLSLNTSSILVRWFVELAFGRYWMTIVQQSMEIDMWEIKEKLTKRREQMAIRAYEEEKRCAELNQKIEEDKRSEALNQKIEEDKRREE
ncbi:hypothetical protein Tco_0523672 [Tanacetum coccineum]